MQDLNYPSKNDNYSKLTQHLLNSESPLNYTLEYLLENYGDRAVPAMMQALPVRPWHECQIILEALGKLGDVRAIVPICSLLYSNEHSTVQIENVVANTLRNLVYYSPDKKNATKILIDTVIRYKGCEKAVANVLKEQKDKYTIKRSYKTLFAHERRELKESAINIIGVEDDLVGYRIKWLKKMLFKTSDPNLKNQIVDALKVLISRKKCKCLCSKKGFKFDAFFRRPDNNSYDCCCADKNGKRVLIKFEGTLISDKSSRDIAYENSGVPDRETKGHPSETPL